MISREICLQPDGEVSIMVAKPFQNKQSRRMLESMQRNQEEVYATY